MVLFKMLIKSFQDNNSEVKFSENKKKRETGSPVSLKVFYLN